MDFRGAVWTRLKSNPELVLQEVGSLRGVMAHQGMPKGMRPDEVFGKMRRLYQLVRSIDDVVTVEILAKL